MRYHVLILIAICAAAQLAGAAELLDSISLIRTLSPERAARNPPARIEGIVTFCNPPYTDLMIHDGRVGLFVRLTKEAAATPQLKMGARVRIEGPTQPGDFLPYIIGQRLTVLGLGPLPEPRRIHEQELFAPELDCQWVEMPAVITGIESGSWYFTLALEMLGWTVKAQLPNQPQANERTAALIAQPVLIRGVVGTAFNSQRQMTGRFLFVASFDQIIPVGRAEEGVEPPLQSVDELLRIGSSLNSRVRVAGTVTHAAKEGLYLRGIGGSLLVRMANIGAVTPGVRVEAVGMAEIAPFRPVLRATAITVVGQSAPPRPEPLALEDNILLIRQQAELVTVDAEFLSRRDGPTGEVVLQCRSGKWFFEALMDSRSSIPPGLKANDHVRLTGICELSTTHPLPLTEWVDEFRLRLRGANDLVVLQRAPWWTLRQLLWALGVAVAAALVALVWATLLRKRVAQQTMIIGAQIEQVATRDERQRIARELHDTIEQELAGLSIQLGNARQRLSEAPDQAVGALELAQRMLRHCRDEARTSIRDLRSVALEQHGLHGALQELLAPIVAEQGARFALDLEGEPRKLAGPAAMHLLRIAREAVANAVRHAAPRKIRVRLHYAADSVTLEVRDDGVGFNTAAPAPRGHFGLLGIRERVNKLQAAFTIESAPGAGTMLRVVVPNNSLIP